MGEPPPGRESLRDDPAIFSILADSSRGATFP